MNVTDSVADLLTRLRNAGRAGLMYTTIPASKLKINVIKVLENEGFIRGFRLIRDNKQGIIKVALKYTEEGEPVFVGMKKVSKPGRRVYKSVLDLNREYASSVGVAIVSTPKGVMTHEAAKITNTGGEVLAYVW